MPIIVPHQSNQAISNASGGQSTPYQNPSAFLSQGQSMANGMATLSQGINNLGNVLLEEEVNKRKEQAEFDVLKDMQDFQANSSAWHDEYMQTHKGADARNAEQDTQAFLTEQSSKLLEKWKGNPTAHKYAQSNIGQIGNSLLNSARAHSTQQEQQYQSEVILAEQRRAENILSDPNTTLEEREKAWTSYAVKRRAYAAKQGEAPEAFQEHLAQVQRNTNYTRLLLQTDASPQEVLRILNEQPRSAHLPEDIKKLSERIAKENNVRPDLITSIVATESAGNATATSIKGAYGLMQLMPDTQKELEKKYGIDGKTPEGNLKLGTLYMKELLQKYDGDEFIALMAYNWGMGNVDSFIKNGHGIKTESNPSGSIPLETKGYVSKVLGKDDENIRTSLSPEQRVKLTSVAEVAFADTQSERLYNDIHANKLTEAEARQEVNAIENKKVRQATQQGLIARLNVDKVQEREDIDTASIKAYDEASSILGSDDSDAKKLSGLYSLMTSAEKKAVTGTKADKAYFNAIQKIYTQASSPLGISKNSSPEEFLTAQAEITYGSITTEKELKLAHPTLARRDIERLSSVLTSSQKVNLAEVNRCIALFEGDNPTNKKLLPKLRARIIQDIIDAAKENNTGNNSEWIKQFVALYYMQGEFSSLPWNRDITSGVAFIQNKRFYPELTDKQRAEVRAEFKANPEMEKKYKKYYGEDYYDRVRFLDKIKEDINKNEPKRPDNVPDTAVWDKKMLGWISVKPTGEEMFFPFVGSEI